MTLPSKLQHDSGKGYSLSKVLEMFPVLKPSRLDYMVRERIVQGVKRQGRGAPRVFSERGIAEIRSYLGRRGDL